MKLKNPEKFISNGDIFYHPICEDCLYFSTDFTCKAFPKGIPDSILFSDKKHTSHVEGQVGNYVFVLRKEKKI
jgi:hypothetical protein